MKIFVVVFTFIMALKVLVMIIDFGTNDYPVTRTLKRDDAAWMLFFRLGLFLWGLLLLVTA